MSGLSEGTAQCLIDTAGRDQGIGQQPLGKPLPTAYPLTTEMIGVISTILIVDPGPGCAMGWPQQPGRFSSQEGESWQPFRCIVHRVLVCGVSDRQMNHYAPSIEQGGVSTANPARAAARQAAGIASKV